MALTQTTELYEILFRFEAGSLKGCHAQYLETVMDGDTTIAQKLGPAIPVSMLSTADGLTVSKVLGSALATVIEAKEAAEASALASDDRAKAAEAKEAEAVAAAGAVTESFAHLIEPAAQLASKDAIIQDLMTQLAKT